MTPVPIGDAERAVLVTLRSLLATIGGANDAEDHGYLEDAARMRTESCEALRQLAATHSFLTQLFPDLLQEVETGHILGFGWAEIHRRAQAYLATPRET